MRLFRKMGLRLLAGPAFSANDAWLLRLLAEHINENIEPTGMLKEDLLRIADCIEWHLNGRVK